MFKTNFYFNDFDKKNIFNASKFDTNFYGDDINDIKNKQQAYYGFEYFLKKVISNNPSISASRFEAEIPKPSYYSFYPFKFHEKFERIFSAINFRNLFYDPVNFSKSFLFQFFFSSFNITPYVLKNGFFRTNTFSGFNFVSLWFNLHFFLPFVFGKFSDSDVKGTFYDNSHPTLFTLRQIFCNYFYKFFYYGNDNASSYKTDYFGVFKFFFIYIYIFFLPFIFVLCFFYIFVSIFIYSLLFFIWRDRILFVRPLSFLGIERSFFFEPWNPVNYFYDKIYQNYISSFIIFCHFPTYFSYYSDPSTTSKGTSYIAVANRVFYNSNARYFFKNTLPFAIKESFYFISGFFGLYKFSRLNIILNDEKYHAIFNSYKNNSSFNAINFYDRFFLFFSYVSNISTLGNVTVSNFTFSSKNGGAKINNSYLDSNFSWPLLTIDSIGFEHREFYKNWHFSKYFVEFELDKNRFPYVDPDFVNFYSKDLSTSNIFISSFTRHDLNKLYSFYNWKNAKFNNFNTSKLWMTFHCTINPKDYMPSAASMLPSLCYNNILKGSDKKISYFFSRFGLIFIPEFSVFYFVFKFFKFIQTYVYFMFEFFDIFFKFSDVKNNFYTFWKIVKGFFSRVFYNIFFFFLRSSSWSFLPFFDHFKNFYINFYTFYNYTDFIRNFYFERSVNKTFFLESLEENDDEETHFSDTVEQSFYNYWWQDFELDIEAMDFFHDEVYDQFTDVFDYEDDEIDYLNTLYSDDADVNVQHYDFEVHGQDNFRDSDGIFSDEVDQDDFEDSYEDLENFFSPVEESSSFVSDNLLFSVFFMRNIIYDVSDLDDTFSHDQYFTGFGPYSSFELHNASYDLYASFWRMYLYNYWNSNVPINEDFKYHVNSQLSRYVSYLNKWHSSQLSSGKYIKIPNIIRSFGELNYVEKNFSKRSFEELTLSVNNLLFPRSIVKRVFFNDQINGIWEKIGKVFVADPNYVLTRFERPEAKKIFDLISKSGFEIKPFSNSKRKFFYFLEKKISNFFSRIFDRSYAIKYEREFVINFFGQFFDSSNFSDFKNFQTDTIKSVLKILNDLNSANLEESKNFFPNPYNYLTVSQKADFTKIGIFTIICSLLTIRFIRKWETFTLYPDDSMLYNNSDEAYTRLINLFSSIQFSSKRHFYAYVKIIVEHYIRHHNATGELFVTFRKDQLYEDILNTSGQQPNNLASFDVLGDLGLFWSDLIPNIEKIYKSWNDPFLSSLFFPEQFYVILDYANISTFDDEEIDMYEEKIDYFTETSTGDLYDDPYESEASPVLEDTSADPDEENFYRGEAVITTVLYEDLFDEDDEYFNPDIHWYEQIEDEPEFDEWEIDFFDEIEDINIPIERIFFGEFYRKFMPHVKDENITSYKKTIFYSPFKRNSAVNLHHPNFTISKENSLVTSAKFDKIADVYQPLDDHKTAKDSNGQSSTDLKSKISFSYHFNYFITNFIKFFMYIFYYIKGFVWHYSVEYSSSLRKPLTAGEQIKLYKHYKAYRHLYNNKFFFEFKKFVTNWLKVYEAFNSSDRLDAITFEIIRSNLKFDYSLNSPLFLSPYAFSWFEDSNMPTDFKWEFYDYIKIFFDLSSSPSFDEDFTVLIDDFIKDFSTSEEIQKIREEHGQEYFEDAFDFGLFILSSFIIDHDDPYFYSENFFYSTLINLYFSKNKKFPYHADLYTRDIYKAFDDDWSSIQNEIGFYKEDSSAWLNLLDNAPEDDYIEDPVTPFYVSEEHIMHSSHEYSGKIIIFFDAIWEFLALVSDYHLYWFKLLFKTYVISYYEAISAFVDKSWFELSLRYGIWVYLFRSFFSFAFLIICSFYIIFIVPRIVFIYTTSHFQLFFSIFLSGLICFFIILLLIFILFSSAYQAYKDINEYERSSFYFASFMSWFTVVWYSIVGYDIYETDDSSSNIFPSLDPDPTFAPDSAMLEIASPEVIDLDPKWHDVEGGSWKPFIAPQPASFGYFVDTFLSQYLNVAHRSLTGHKFRHRLQYHDPVAGYYTSDSIGSYIHALRRRENFMRGGKGVYGHYGSERHLSRTSRFTTRKNNLKVISKKNAWLNRYSDLRYTTQRLSKLRRIDRIGYPTTIDFNWKGFDPLFGYKEDERESEEDKFYKGRNIYTSVTDHSRYFVRNYYDEVQGDHEMPMWNIHFRPYDWFGSNYLSHGFYSSIKKFSPFNIPFDPKNYYNNFTDYLHFFEPVVNFVDYRLPERLHFAQKFVYGNSVFHYKTNSLSAPYSNNKNAVFSRLNHETPEFQYYISNLVSKSTQFNFIKEEAAKAHFKYFYFNRYRYYISKVNPNSRLFSRASFQNLGGWPIIDSKDIDIYSYDYPLFMENMQYDMIGYDKRLQIMRDYYYTSIKRPKFNFKNLEFFNWLLVNFRYYMPFTDHNSYSFEIFKFQASKFLAYCIFFNDKIALQNELFKLANDFEKFEQAKRYSFYWKFFWSKTTSKILDKNVVSLPSSSLLLSPNYLPANYSRTLAIRRHYLDSINFNSRTFSRKQFKRFWYRSTFVPLVDDNPVRMSENFHSFKAYESGLPISPTFKKKVSDPISRFIKKGVRRPIFRENYTNFLINKYYKNFFDDIVNFSKKNDSFSSDDTSFIRLVDTNLFTSTDLRAFNNYSYELFFTNPAYEIRRNHFTNTIFSASSETAKMFRHLYSYDIMARRKINVSLRDNFFKGKNSRYYLKQIYRYPFSRAASRVYYDAINDTDFSRNNITPGYAHHTIFDGSNLLPYYSLKQLKIPEYSPFLNVYEDKSTSVTNYFRARFNRKSIGNFRLGQYGYINSNRIINIYQSNRFKWGGRHTVGLNYRPFKSYRRNYNVLGNKYFSSKFNLFPYSSKMADKKINPKSMSNLLSKISRRESKSIRRYNIEYDWPGSKELRNEFVLHYPFSHSFVTDYPYVGTSSVLNGRGLYSFYEKDFENFTSPDIFQEIYDETPYISLTSWLIKDNIIPMEYDIKYNLINKRLEKFDLPKSTNIGLIDPIDFAKVEHPRSLFYRKVFKKNNFNYKPKLLTRASESTSLLRSENARVKNLKFTSLTLRDSVNALVLGLDNTPIYSKNYAKKFQRKSAFFSYFTSKINVINTYSWGDEQFNNYVKNHYIFGPKNFDNINEIKDNEVIKKYYKIAQENSTGHKLENLGYKKLLIPTMISPLEKYIVSSHNNHIKFYCHSPFPFLRRGRAITIFISNRRNIYKDRVISRLQKYISAQAFERTYSRVFNGSRVPVMRYDPFKLIINSVNNEAPAYPAFEIMSNKEFNDRVTLKEIKIILDMVRNGTISKEEFLTKYRKIDRLPQKHIFTYDTNKNISNSTYNGYSTQFYSHVNMSDILVYKLKQIRLKNPQFINKKDLEFFVKNMNTLVNKTKDFTPSKYNLYSKQSPSSLKIYEYVINRGLYRSKAFNKEISNLRSELNKFKPGIIKKESLVTYSTIKNSVVYANKKTTSKNGNATKAGKRNELIIQAEKENRRILNESRAKAAAARQKNNDNQ